MKVFHYTFPSRYKKMREEENPRLLLSDKWIFALTEPEPAEWVNNIFFPDVWDQLNRHVGNLLLEVDVSDYLENTFVVDRAHMIKFNSVSPATIRPETPKEYLHKTREEAIDAYYGGKIKLLDYLNNGFHYFLPEVIINTPIPLCNAVESFNQPLLEHELRFEKEFITAVGEKPKVRIRPIEERIQLANKYLDELPGLMAWYNNYINQLKENS